MNPGPCPRCKRSDQVDLVEFLPGGFLVKTCCGACGFDGPLAETEAELGQLPAHSSVTGPIPPVSNARGWNRLDYKAAERTLRHR